MTGGTGARRLVLDPHLGGAGPRAPGRNSRSDALMRRFRHEGGANERDRLEILKAESKMIAPALASALHAHAVVLGDFDRPNLDSGTCESSASSSLG